MKRLTRAEAQRLVYLHDAHRGFREFETELKRTAKPKQGYDRRMLVLSVESVSDGGSETDASVEIDLETAVKLMPAVRQLIENALKEFGEDAEA